MKHPACISLFCLSLALAGCAAPVPETVPQTISVTLPETKPIVDILPPAETQQEDTPMETQSTLLIDPQDADFVRVRDYIPDIREELKYATDDNFTGAVIYPFQDAYLRYGSVRKLMAVQEELRAIGLGLKIWDSFRPISAQFRLWEIYPDPTYVANPNVGFSNHSRGNAVDLTMVDLEGNSVEMPTEFDDFTGKADRSYSEIPELPRHNALLLEEIMQRHGFQGYYGEWWHFNDTDRYEPERVFDPGVVSLWVTLEDCALRSTPDADSPVLSPISKDEPVTVMGYTGDYALVTARGQRGYITCLSLFPAESVSGQ